MDITYCYILLTSLEKENFAVTFADAVHGGLDKVLGHSGTTAALYHTKMTEGLPDAAEFHKKLLALFGLQGTLSLERAIVKDLAKRLQWSMDLLNIDGSFDFNGVVGTVKNGVKP